MFRVLCSKLYRPKGSLFNGDPTLPFLIRLSSTSSAKPDSFTVSYLINTCGLSHEKAISTSMKVQFQTSNNPDSVLNFLKTYNFSNIHISKIIEKRPLMLLSNPDKTLKPKLEYFSSMGLSGPELAAFVSKDPAVLLISLDKSIKPAIDFLKTVVHTESNAITVFKRAKRILQFGPQKMLASNISVLHAHGVPDCQITRLVVMNASVFMSHPLRFSAIVEKVKEMNFDPRKYGFVAAIRVLSGLSKFSLESKFDTLRRWGLSEDEVYKVFRLQPNCMALSKKNIVSTMEFLVKRAGFNPLLIVKYPSLLSYSLKKRIIPRLSTIEVLMSNGLVEKDCNMVAMLNISNKNFLKKFVTKYVEKVPELLNRYQEKMNDM